MWALLQRLRRCDRWWQRRVRRRPYPFLLPGHGSNAMCDTVVVVRRTACSSPRTPTATSTRPSSSSGTPPAITRPGATVRCTRIEIPQVRRTHAVLLSRPVLDVGRRDGRQRARRGDRQRGGLHRASPTPKAGLTGMDLLRLALERAATAAEAVDVITGAARGARPGRRLRARAPRRSRYHNSFLVADPRAGLRAGDRRPRSGRSSRSRRRPDDLQRADHPRLRRGRTQRVRTHFSRCRTRRAVHRGRARRSAGVPT